MSLSMFLDICEEAKPHLTELPDVREHLLGSKMTDWDPHAQLSLEVSSLQYELSELTTPPIIAFLVLAITKNSTKRENVRKRLIDQITAEDLQQIRIQYPVFHWICIRRSSLISYLGKENSFIWYLAGELDRDSYWRPVKFGFSKQGCLRAVLKYWSFGYIPYFGTEKVDPLHALMLTHLFPGRSPQRTSAGELSGRGSDLLGACAQHMDSMDDLHTCLTFQDLTSNAWTYHIAYLYRLSVRSQAAMLMCSHTQDPRPLANLIICAFHNPTAQEQLMTPVWQFLVRHNLDAIVDVFKTLHSKKMLEKVTPILRERLESRTSKGFVYSFLTAGTVFIYKCCLNAEIDDRKLYDDEYVVLSRSPHKEWLLHYSLQMSKKIGHARLAWKALSLYAPGELQFDAPLSECLEELVEVWPSGASLRYKLLYGVLAHEKSSVSRAAVANSIYPWAEYITELSRLPQFYPLGLIHLYHMSLSSRYVLASEFYIHLISEEVLTPQQLVDDAICCQLPELIPLLLSLNLIPDIELDIFALIQLPTGFEVVKTLRHSMLTMPEVAD